MSSGRGSSKLVEASSGPVGGMTGGKGSALLLLVGCIGIGKGGLSEGSGGGRLGVRGLIAESVGHTEGDT